MTCPPIQMMYELRDALTEALPLHAVPKRVRYARDKFGLAVLTAKRARELIFHATIDGETLHVTVTVLGRELRADGPDARTVARKLATEVAAMLKPRPTYTQKGGLA